MKVSYLTVKLPILLWVILTLAASAFAQEVRYNYVPGTNFAKYKTYKWVEVPNHKYPNQIVDAQIKQAIDKQLALKGLKGISEGSPDLLVTYQVAIDQQTEWNAYGGGWRMGPRTVTTSAINVGTLVVDFYDAAANQQIWTGSATKQLNPSKDPVKNQKNLDKAMAKLMKNYPPPVKN